jgi:ABC-type multidrug transport system ATPase subunit
MDPQAKRHIWNIIEKLSMNRTVILVSHSMEEVEALCHRVGVMMNGKLQCLGSIEHLKEKYGGGYLVEVKCAIDKVEECLDFCFQIALKKEATEKIPLSHCLDLPLNVIIDSKDEMKEEEQQPVGRIMEKSYSLSVATRRRTKEEESFLHLEERHGGYFKLKVNQELDLVKAFEEFEKHKSFYKINDYSISQLSLEQVFMNSVNSVYSPVFS